MARNKFSFRAAALALGFFIGIGALLHVSQVNAQELIEAGNVGLDQIQQTSGLGDASFGKIVGQILRVLLSLLGVITISMVIYGGFLYMTSSGNEENIDKAKRTLANGVIGLVIVLASFAITEFVIRSVGNATGTDVSGIIGTPDSGGNLDGGTGSFIGGSGATSGGLQVKTIVPKGTQSYANLRVTVSFTQNIDETSVKDHASVTTADGQPVSGTWSVAGDSISFTPSAPCAAPNADRRCFESGKEYKVTVVGGKAGIVAATSKKPLACSGSSCTATFTAGDKVDVTGPEISNLEPRNNEKIPLEQVVPIQALLKDDAAIGFGRVEVDGVVVETISPTDGRQEYLMVTRKFHTKGDKLGKEYTIVVTAQDLAGNEARVSYKVQAAANTCFNKLKDGDEVDIDCSAAGGACGICPNVKCQTSLQCTNGSVCDDNKKVCVSAPIIKTVQPQDGAPGTYVTLTGVGFGTQFGDVFFEGDPSTEDDDVQAALACAGSWSDTQAVVRVPDNAKTGPIALRNNAGSKDQTDDQDGIMLRAFTVNDVQRPGLCTVTPTSGEPGKTKLILTGNEFLTNASFERALFIGGYKVDATWGSDGAGTASAFVPFLYPGKTSIQFTAKSVPSNPLDFFVNAAGTGSVSGTGTGSTSGSGSSGSGTGSTSGGGGTSGGSSSTGSNAKITSLSPQKGGVGQYVTINGVGFGSTPSRVYFVVLDQNGKLTSDQTVGDISFPSQCAKSFWTDTQTIVKVPDLAPARYAVVVQPYGNVPQITYNTFEVTTDKPGAQVCAIQPASGPADGKVKVTLYGDNFGDAYGAVIFGNKYYVLGNATGSSWSRTSATVVVPTGTATGEVRVAQAQPTMTPDVCQKNPSVCSNAVTYTVLDCRTSGNSCAAGSMCCGDGTCQKSCAGETSSTDGTDTTKNQVKGVFAWCFSTGDSCDVIQPPRVVESCSATTPKTIPSPSPAAMWPSTAKGGACSNALISIKFSEPVDPSSVDISSGAASSIVVEECVSADGLCSEVSSQLVSLGDLTVSGQVDAQNAGLFVVPRDLKASTMYRVTLKKSIVGAETGMQLMRPSSPNSANTCEPSGDGVYCYYFKTTANQEACQVDSVGVAPSEYTVDNLGPVIDPFSEFKDLQYWLPLAYPADGCQVLNPNSYAWTWSPAKSTDEGYSFATPMSTTGSRTAVLAKQPTPSKKTTPITVTENRSKKSGSGALTINLGAPLLTEACEVDGPRSPSPSVQWGGDVCFDSPVVVEFNQPVVTKGSGGNDTSFAVKISECTGQDGDKKCDSLSPNSPFETTMEYRKISETRHIYEFNTITPKAKSTTYLVEIPTTTKGVGEFGKSMSQKQGCRAGVAQCFTFTTAESEESCQLKRVEVMPFDWRATEYGIQKTYNESGDSVDQKWYAQGFGSNPCVWLKNNFSWNWGVDADHTGYAFVDPPLSSNTVEGLIGKYWDTSEEQVVAAYRETIGDDRVKIQASASGVTGTGLMSITFPTPTVVRYEPSACGAGSVCTNSALSIGFSTPMNLNSIAQHAFVYACPDDVCEFKNDFLRTLRLVPQKTNDSGKDFSLVPDGRFSLNKKYRVILRSDMTSTAGKRLAGMNYPANNPTYFSWTFTVTQDQCAVNRVDVAPISPVARAAGETQEFTALAYTAPDSCYPNGQLLDSTKLSWNWSTSDNNIADIISVTNTFKQVFRMEGKGTVLDNVQTARITATTGVRSGTSEWKLQCNAPPATCPAGTWAGSDKCCHLPPSVVATFPKSGDSSVCRNTLITFDVNDVLDVASITTSTVQLGFLTTELNCTSGAYTNGFCFNQIPFTVTSVSSNPKEGGDSTRVILNLLEPIPQNTRVKLLIRPTGNDAPAEIGLRSQRGVPVLGQTVLFGTGTNFCEVTDVAVFPENAYFTKTTDKQSYAAYGLSKQGNDLLPISSIPNVYAWSWNWFSGDTRVAKYETEAAAKTDKPVVIPGGINGQTSVTALAQIVADTAIKPTTVGRTIAGTGSIEAMLCEIPWIPEQNTTLAPILRGQNMSFWYCRASGNTLLPSLTVVEDNLSDLSLGTLKSFRLVDGQSGGAIGFRVEKNLKQYSPYEWYLQREFKGEPQRISVDGFEAVRVGNTIYAGFANQFTGDASVSQFTNILVVSLSEPASENMKAIFNQIVENLQFLTNIRDVGLCSVDGQPTNKTCQVDSYCAALKPTPDGLTFGLKFVKDGSGRYFGATCNPDSAGKYQLVWIDPITSVVAPNVKMGIAANAGDAYIDTSTDASRTFLNICKTKLPIGKCQKNQNISCVSNNNCGADGDVCVFPGVQQCLVDQSKLRRDTIRVVGASSMVRSIEKAKAFAQKYPIIAQNSYIPGITSSKWPSWESFMQQLGTAVIADPLNTYGTCGPDSDPQTCWSTKSKQYQCSPDSSVYHYRTINSGENYQIGIPLEQSTALQGTWQGDPDGWLAAKSKNVSDFCTGSPATAAAVCGDGAVGPGEECDPSGSPVSGTNRALCPAYGAFTATCSATCKIEKLQCVSMCGDGVIQSPTEECDDGAKFNGKYNYCGSDCKVNTSLGMCGDGVEQVGIEACDIATPVGRTFIGVAESKFVGVRCEADNKYTPMTFAQNLATVMPFTALGTGNITAQADAAYAVQLPDLADQVCDSNEKIGQCSGYSVLSCLSNTHCPTGSTCIKPVVGTKYSFDKANSCNWNCKSTGSYCGDGVVDALNGEQCDGDVTETNVAGNQCVRKCSKSCTWALTLNTQTNVSESVCEEVVKSTVAVASCGDGIVNPSLGEECDAGGQNDKPCVPLYGAQNSCQYCSSTCKKAFVSGGFCGDGKTNGSEMCDGEDMPTVCDAKQYDYHTFTCSKQCVVDSATGGSCQSCIANTKSYTEKDVNDSRVVRSGAVLIDPTVGWLPGNISVSADLLRKNNGIDTLIGPGVTYVGESELVSGQPQFRVKSIAFDSNSACFTSAVRYNISARGDGYKYTISSEESEVLSNYIEYAKTSAFSYEPVSRDYVSVTSFTETHLVEMQPKGNEGDYRVIMNLPSNNGNTLVLKISNKKNTATIPENYYVGISGEPLCPGSGSFANGMGYSLSKVSGCIESGAFAQLETARAMNGQEEIPNTRSYALTIRKPNSNSFYDAIYSVEVRSNSSSESAQIPAGTTITVYQKKNGIWGKVYVRTLDRVVTGRNSVWSVFNFVGNGAITDGAYSN